MSYIELILFFMLCVVVQWVYCTCNHMDSARCIIVLQTHSHT